MLYIEYIVVTHILFSLSYMLTYDMRLTFRRTVLINPDGSSFIINCTTDNEYTYGFSSINLLCKLYAGYLPQFIAQPVAFLFIKYTNCLLLPGASAVITDTSVNNITEKC